MDILWLVQMIVCDAWELESSQPSAFSPEPQRIFPNGIIVHPGPLDSQELRGVEEHSWRRHNRAGAFKDTVYCFAVVILDHSRVFPSWFADHDMAQPDHPIVCLYRHATSNANQQAISEVLERHPHLGDDCGRRAISNLMETGNHNIVAIDAAELVNVVIRDGLLDRHVLFIQHLQRRDLF
jgi:hypothetical protein